MDNFTISQTQYASHSYNLPNSCPFIAYQCPYFLGTGIELWKH